MQNNIPSLAMGVITAPRIKDTAKRMLLGLKTVKHIPKKIHVFAEPNAPVPDDNLLVVHQNETQLGCFKNFYHTHKWLLENTACDYILVLADDVKYKSTFIQKAFEHIQQINIERMGYLALYTPSGMRQFFNDVHGRTPERVILNYGFGGGGWGGCYLMHRKNATRIFRHHAMLDHYENYKANQQFDEIVKECCHQLRLNQYYINPSLFDHIGVTSTIGHQYRAIDKGLNHPRA